MESHEEMFFGGAWRKSSSGSTITVLNPATEEIIGTVPCGNAADIELAVKSARDQFDNGSWASLPMAQRVGTVRKALAAIAKRTDEIVGTLIAEMGSPIGGKGSGQVTGLPGLSEAQIDAATNFTWTEERPGPAGRSVVERRPAGVVGLIVAWNGPLFLSVQKLVPALVAGCTVIVKSAPQAPLAFQAMAECFAEAGFPEGAIHFLHGEAEAGEALVAHPDVDLISFTGSAAVGRRIGSVCGEQIKRCILELGGKSAAVLLEDGAVEDLVGAVIGATFANNGQQCYALSRVLAPRQRYDEVVEALAAAVSDLVVGDPLDPSTQIGPVISEHDRDRIIAMVDRAVGAGARLTTGGKRPSHLSHGFFVEPAVLVDVDNSMEIAQEEVFGPVVVVIPYDTVDDAVRIANDSKYGLSGAVFSADRARAIELAGKLRTGMVSINCAVTNWNAPFGGLKQSGLGREYGPEGLAEFLEPQSIHFLG